MILFIYLFLLQFEHFLACSAGPFNVLFHRLLKKKGMLIALTPREA